MSSEVAIQAACGGSSIDDYHHPIFNSDAVPFAYAPDNRPCKRLRIAAKVLSRIDTISACQLQREELESAQSLNGNFPTQQVNFRADEQEQQRPQSVPPQSKRGRKRKNTQKPQDGPWIQETFAFPAQQTWLKVKPRQRKATMEFGAVEQAVALSSAPPVEGEDLCLDKHADRIAALIAQKRWENDSKLFRERISLQQRLHRGETDDKDTLIAASHDELKRKMELSARGIFEEDPPNGKQVALTQNGRQPPSWHTSSQRSSVVWVARSAPPAAAPSTTPAFLRIDHREDEAALGIETNELEIDDELSRQEVDESKVEKIADPIESIKPPMSQQGETMIAPSTYVPCEETEYYKTPTTVTTQTFAFSDAPSQPQTTGFLFTQPGFTHQPYQNPRIWQIESEQEAMSQRWTSEMAKALPSTSTPILETREVANGREHVSLNHEQNVTLNLFGSSSTSEVYSSYHGSKLLSDEVSSADQPQTAVLRSNMNIFTRLARENGVIGGNNNYLELGGEGGKRRNMFDNRM